MLLASSANAATINGTGGRISDGDTFWACNSNACTKIRLCGINAPELEEARGPASKAALSRLLAGKTVRCVPVGEGTPCDGRSPPISYDRIVAQCFIGNEDVAARLVRDGTACDWTRFSGGHYAQGDPKRTCP